MKDVKNGNRTLQIWKHNGNTFIRDGDEDCIELTPSNIQEVVNIVLQLNGIGITPSPSSLTWEEVLKEAEKYADKGAAYFEHGSGKTITRLTLIIDYLQRYPLHPPMEWVKVEDRLPELTETAYWYDDNDVKQVRENKEHALVLGFSPSIGRYMAKYSKSWGWEQIGPHGTIRVPDTTEWQPLPPSPQK